MKLTSIRAKILVLAPVAIAWLASDGGRHAVVTTQASGDSPVLPTVARDASSALPSNVARSPRPASAAAASSRSTPTDHRGDYVGSEACEGCHTYIYRRWRGTRHARSVLTADEAQERGYPLPGARRAGTAPAIRSWDDVLYVFGGRQRIAYVDTAGRVHDAAWHHRTGEWRPFPAKRMECGPCHVTGMGAGADDPDRPVVSGRWAELNVGCEACHGPGARHVESYDAADIAIDPSPRSCGTCHTSVGRVLPQDDLHDGHDVVQNWNRDPHVTGTRLHSHSAFCASCHSPYEGYFVDAGDDGRRAVFAEAKRAVTCIGCHDPHDSTNAAYTGDTVWLGPPRASVPQVHTGHDRDFTTVDFRELASTEQVCTHCHRGADRVELDHAGATCNDCHVAFRRNRGPASPVLHDANRRDLSCRPCHQDADHLMTILFRDPAFLQPKHVHDLRRLPDAVVAKYGFRVGVSPGRHRGDASAARQRRQDRGDARGRGAGGDALSSGARRTDESGAAGAPRRDGPAQGFAGPLRELLGSASHMTLARRHDDVAALQQALLRRPESPAGFVDLARGYADHGAFDPAHDVLLHAARLDAPRIVLELPLGDAPAGSAADADAVARARAVTERLLPGDDTLAGRRWLSSYLLLRDRRFAPAAALLRLADADADATWAPSFYRGLAELGLRRHAAAAEALEAALRSRPDHRAARAALALVQLERRWSGRALTELERGLDGVPDDPVLLYLKGRAHAQRRDPAAAARAFEAAVAADPDLTPARYALARAYRRDDRIDAAMAVYDRIIARRPDDARAHERLGRLYKWTSDRLAFDVESLEETAPPPGTDPESWRARHARERRRSRDAAERALDEFALALKLKPLDPEIIRQVAEIYRGLDRDEEALECFRWLARRQPGWWIHPYRVGTLLVEAGRHEEAIEALARALALSPPGGDVHLALGLAQLRAGRLDEAIATFEEGTIREPFNPVLFTNLGAARARRGEALPARRALLRALELGTFPLPRQHLTYTNLALLELRAGRREAGMAALENALWVHPDDATAQGWLDAANDPTRSLVVEAEDFVVNDRLEIFGEVTTVAFEPFAPLER